MKDIHQIQLQKLLFTQNWEDPASDLRAMQIQPGEVVAAITSGGCNMLGFLLKDPSMLYGVDINGSQNWQMELKMAAIRRLDYPAFLAFLGLSPSAERLETYEWLRPDLSAEAQVFWDAKKSIIKKGFLSNGRFENFVKLAGKLVAFVQGRRRVRRLFEEKTPEEQRQYYDEVWDTRRMRFIFGLLFNKRILARRGLNADYFHFDDGSSSFAESFYKRLRKAVRDIPLAGNYFASMYFLGKYRQLDEAPDYLLPQHFDAIRQRLARIRLVTMDAKEWLASLPDNSIDCFALSNICELMSLDDTERLFRQVVRTAKPGARICFRNLMIPREVPDVLKMNIEKDELLSRDLLATDRSFVYSKVAAYRVKK
jgi:S-adenosylmethionine-diacylglycerol 3-amino-3-carboxypropyl transferase